jgi:putative phosphoribosyl transferase
VTAALRGVRRSQPLRLVLAVPVAPQAALEEIARECDGIVCLAAPEPFYAVGAHYADFAQTTDDEVRTLLDAAMKRRAGAASESRVE